jgi:CheY-like chemotaxis protein
MSNPINPTILVVEDNPEDAALLHLTLHEVASLNIHTISDCTAALAYLSASEPYTDGEEFPFPSLVVLDMHLPGHSGPRILKWIREHNVPTRLLVVILGKSSLIKVPGQITERYDNLTISFAPFLSTDSNEMAKMIIDLYERWNGQPVEKAS